MQECAAILAGEQDFYDVQKRIGQLEGEVRRLAKQEAVLVSST
jgi:hypothetical protein